MLYYADTMQAKAMKLMASKLAVAGIIEGTFSEEGLAAMSDVKDMTSQMAKELAQGIKDNVEDIASAFKKMAIINPERRRVKAEQAVAEEAPEQVPITAACGPRSLRNSRSSMTGCWSEQWKIEKRRSRRKRLWMKTNCLSSILSRKRRNCF